MATPLKLNPPLRHPEGLISTQLTLGAFAPKIRLVPARYNLFTQGLLVRATFERFMEA